MVMIANVDLPEAPEKYKLPQLSNATAAMLVDEVARVRKWKSYFDSADKALAVALKARLDGKKEAEGEFYVMNKTESTQVRISPDLCREHLTPELLAKVEYELTMEQMRFSRKAIATADLEKK